MWKSVVNSINLSEQQKLNIVQWKQLFMQKVGGHCDTNRLTASCASVCLSSFTLLLWFVRPGLSHATSPCPDQSVLMRVFPLPPPSGSSCLPLPPSLSGGAHCG